VDFEDYQVTNIKGESHTGAFLSSKENKIEELTSDYKISVEKVVCKIVFILEEK
jgi:hypothetical protein